MFQVRQSLSPEARSESLSVSEDSESQLEMREASPGADISIHPQDQDISDSENTDPES